MLIDCPACARSYHVSRAEIGDGRTVICPRCDTQWFVDVDGTGTLMPEPSDLRAESVSTRPAASPVTPYDDLAEAAMPRRSFLQALRPVFGAIACVALAMVALGAREPIVRMMPRTADLYARIGLPVNLRGLEIQAVVSERPEAAPSDVTLTGTIRNVAHRRVVLPRLAYEIRDGAGMSLVTWTETAPARTLAVGGTLAFGSAPHRLPPDARAVLVRFAENDDPTPAIRVARRSN